MQNNCVFPNKKLNQTTLTSCLILSKCNNILSINHAKVVVIFHSTKSFAIYFLILMFIG